MKQHNSTRLLGHPILETRSVVPRVWMKLPQLEIYMATCFWYMSSSIVFVMPILVASARAEALSERQKCKLKLSEIPVRKPSFGRKSMRVGGFFRPLAYMLKFYENPCKSIRIYRKAIKNFANTMKVPRGEEANGRNHRKSMNIFKNLCKFVKYDGSLQRTRSQLGIEQRFL